jgi:L-lysine 6-transaminase
MVRSRRILEIVEREGLIEAAGPKGEALLAALGKVEAAHPALLSNVRGRGLLVAVDVPDSETRDVVLRRLREDEHVLTLGSGERSVRFRPALSVTVDELERAADALGRVLDGVESER